MKEHFVVLVTTAATLNESTLELASRLAGRANAVLMFLHVEAMVLGQGESMLHRGLDIASGDSQRWHRGLRPTDPAVAFRHRFEVGDSDAVVAHFVAQHVVELVVAEEPPRNWISEMMWRGFAERLVRRVDCPVVIGGPGFLRATPRVPPPVPTWLDASTVGELLNATVEARADALSSWMRRCAAAVAEIASGETLRTVAAIVETGRGPIDRGLKTRMFVELDEHQRALQAMSWQVRCGGYVWGARSTPGEGKTAFDAFVDRVVSAGASCSLPLVVGEDEERLMIFAGARVGHGGLLLVGLDAERDFLRILAQPGPFPSFETYAFDASGLMLSNSRFPHHLVASGLLATEGQQTPLRLRVAEPSDGPPEDWPLTQMVQDAIRPHDGFDTRGYLDYRGTRVVGAWRWIPEYSFGVAAEVDYVAAYPRR